jgi:hypothetical protein
VAESEESRWRSVWGVYVPSTGAFAGMCKQAWDSELDAERAAAAFTNPTAVAMRRDAYEEIRRG